MKFTTLVIIACAGLAAAAPQAKKKSQAERIKDQERNGLSCGPPDRDGIVFCTDGLGAKDW